VPLPALCRFETKDDDGRYEWQPCCKQPQCNPNDAPAPSAAATQQEEDVPLPALCRFETQEDESRYEWQPRCKQPQCNPNDVPPPSAAAAQQEEDVSFPALCRFETRENDGRYECQPPFMRFSQCSTAAGTEDGERTTVMLRNIPNDYTRNMLVDLLDSEGFKGRFNFVYLPMDFKRVAGLGYAFVNMETPEDANEAWKHFNGFKQWTLQSMKVCEVAWGQPLQGLKKHIDRYRNSPVMHDDVPEEHKPVLFNRGQRIPFPHPTKRIRVPRMKYRTPAEGRASTASPTADVAAMAVAPAGSRRPAGGGSEGTCSS